VILAGLVSGLVSDAQTAWLGDWEYRKKIAIEHNKVAGDLTDFPVLVSITDADLKAGAKPDGSDIVVTSADGTNKLSREIEEYDDSDGTLALWFKAPNLWGSADTRFYLYYGNATASETNDPATWDSHYVLVLHLSETNTNFDNSGYDEHYDSTSYTNHAGWFKDNKGFGGGTMNTNGKIAGGDFMGYPAYQSNDQIRVDHDASLNFRTNDFTVSIWMRTQSGQGYGLHGEGSLITKIEFDAPTNGWRFGLYACCPDPNTALRTYYMTGGATREERIFNTNDIYLADDEWHYVGMSLGRQPAVDSNLIFWADDKIHVNNTAYDGAAAIDQDGDEDVYIGSVQGGSFGWFGFLDEVRISNVARDSNWIATSYNNQGDPSSFHTLGLEEFPPRGMLLQVK
jgi:hypothetical protein